MNLAHLLLVTAQGLRSDGSNPEYDRALVELARDAIGLSVESDAALAALIHRGPCDCLACPPCDLCGESPGVWTLPEVSVCAGDLDDAVSVCASDLDDALSNLYPC